MHRDHSRDFEPNCHAVGFWVGIVASVGSVLVLLGWLLNIDLLTRIYPGWPAMHPLTAISCALLGLSLMLHLAPTSALHRLPQTIILHKEPMLQWLLVLLLAVAGIQIALYLIAAPAKLDNLLFPSLSSNETHNPSRMSLPTAIMLMLLTIAFLIQLMVKRGMVWISQGSLVVTAVLALLSLIGHVIKAEFFYGYFTSIYTSMLALVLVLGVACVPPGHGLVRLLGSEGMARTLLIWLLPLGVVLPASLGLLDLFLRDNHILGRESAVYVKAASTTLLILIGVIVTSWRIYGMELALRRTALALRRSESELQQFNSELELRIDERTAALRESEAHFRSAMHYSPIGLALVAPDYRVLDANEALSQLIGYPHEELLGLTFKDITHLDDLGAERNRARQMLAGEIETYQKEIRYLHKSGRTIWALLNASLVRKENGTPQHFILQVQDITARKKIEQAMQSVLTDLVALEGDAYYQMSAFRLAEILDADIAFVSRMESGSPDTVHTIAMVENGSYVPNIRYVWADTPCARVITGNALVIKDGVQHQYPADDYLKKKAIQGYAAMPLQDVNGQVMGLLGVMKRSTISDSDVVTQTLSAFALAAAGQMSRERDHQRYQDLFEFSPDALLMTNQEGLIVKANHQAEQLFGWTRNELIGQPVEMLIPKQVRAKHVDMRDQYIQEPTPRPMGRENADLQALRKDSSTFPVDISLSPMNSEEGMMIAVSIRDISERKQAELAIHALNDDLERRVEERTRLLQIANKQLEQARNDAQKANRAKSAFLATMSHEIRTPINGVIGMLDVLSHSKLDLHQSDAVSTIRDSAFTLLRLIDDILDFSKIEAGRLDLEEVPVSITEIAESVCSTLVPIAEKKGVDLVLFVEPRVPALISSDPTRLRQVLYNLIGNAIKFSGDRPERRGHVSIRVEPTDELASHIIISIDDNGIGMTTETQARLFSTFSQGESSTTRRFGGTGLGLAISRRLVEMMGGDIAVKSVLSEGSSFTVTLPVETIEACVEQQLQDLSGLECIVVENPEYRANDLSSYLEDAGAHVLIAPDLKVAATQAVGVTPPMVIVHDANNGAYSTDKLHTEFSDATDVRHLVITRGRRRRPRLIAPDIVTLDLGFLQRRVLLRAVAVAAGRASPEISYENNVEDSAHAKAAPPTVAEARVQGKLILLAEDDLINQKVILQQLSLLGYAGEMANNGAVALQLWRRNTGYAMVLTDLHMPEMDGYSLAKAIRSEEKKAQHIPIVVLTANALRGEEVKAKDIGVDDYLTKPVQLTVLKGILEKWVSSQETTVETGITDRIPIPDQKKTEKSAVDLDVLRGLVGNDENIVHEFLMNYLSISAEQVADLRSAIAADDAQHVAAVAHKLKSSSRSIGALSFGDCCAELESACKAGNRPAIQQAILSFEEEYVMVEGRIKLIVERK